MLGAIWWVIVGLSGTLLSAASPISTYGGLFLLTASFLLQLWYTPDSQVIYFVVQEGAALVFFFTYFVGLPSGFMVGALLVKMATVPGHGWFKCLLPRVRWSGVVLFFSALKVVPLWLVAHLYPRTAWGPSLGALFLASLGVYFALHMKTLFLYSASSHAYWVFLLLSGSLYHASLYCGVYFLAFVTLLHSYASELSEEVLFPVGLFFILIGLPPFPGFTVKWAFLTGLSQASPVYATASLVLLLAAMWGYFRFWAFFAAKSVPAPPKALLLGYAPVLLLHVFVW